MKRWPLFAPRYRRLLLFVGPGILVAGLVAGILTETWLPLPLGLVLLGLIVAMLGVQGFGEASFRFSSSAQRGQARRPWWPP